MRNRVCGLLTAACLLLASLAAVGQLEVIQPQEKLTNPQVSAETANAPKMSIPTQNAFLSQDKWDWQKGANRVSGGQIPRQFLQSQKEPLLSNTLALSPAAPLATAEGKAVGVQASAAGNRLPARLRSVNAFVPTEPKIILGNRLPASATLKGFQLRQEEKIILSNTLPEVGQ